jgi:hypothetical protein
MAENPFFQNRLLAFFKATLRQRADKLWINWVVRDSWLG